MADQQPHWWQRLFQHIAASRAIAWFLARVLHHLDRPILDLTNGRLSLPGILTGLPVVLVTTTGARSGEPRTIPLAALEDGDKLVLIGSNFGSTHHPAWYHNLCANPQATVEIRGRTGTYIARQVTGGEREIYWRRAVALYVGYAAYKERTGGRPIPIIVLTPETV